MSLIRNLNPNNATGTNGISGQMLIYVTTQSLLPLKMLFQNILVISKYPDMWKLANVRVTNNYRPIYLLQFVVKKILKKIIFNNLFSYLNANQSGFVQVIPQPTNY